MLIEGDIAVIPRPLANYHVRPDRHDRADSYANTVVAALHDHTAADAAFRNRHMRRDIASGKAGLGMLLAIGRLQSKASGGLSGSSALSKFFNIVKTRLPKSR
jgi:hypothetical protein